MKFKVGDRVLAIDNIGKFKDWTEGVVSEVPPAAPGYRVRFPYGGNLYVKDSKSIKPLHSGGNHKIVITADGKTTLARLYDGDKVVKSKEAKCSPTDTFSFQTGAELAFKRLFENPVEKPEPPKAEPAPEPKTDPVKLYCVKSFFNWLTKGKVYESVAGGISGSIDTDDGDRHTDWVLRKGGYLFPLVKRPAKVGEWVYINNAAWNAGLYKNGDVFQAEITFHDGDFINKKEGGVFGAEYLVLDGYQPKPEKKPEFYNGKVVCVECPSDTGPYTPGKIYTFKDGFTCDDNGNKRPSMFARKNPRTEGIHDFDDWKNFTFARFIEYRGEA